MAHAELGASNAARWINCPGSVAAERGREDKGSKYAWEGTAAHRLAELAFSARRDAGKWLGDWLEWDEHGTAVKVQVTEEMVQAVRVYLGLLEDLTGECDWHAIEQRFDLSPLEGTPAPMFGTADFVGWRPGVLVVADLKYGKGVTVQAEDNHQLRYYALGALVSLALQDRAKADAVEMVWVHICQPRVLDEDGLPSIRVSHIPIEDLKAWGRTMLEAARATQAPAAPRVAGDWCKFCKAKADCATFRNVALAVAQLEFADIAEPAPVQPPPVEGLTSEQVSRILEHKAVLEEWLSAVEARAFADLEAGVVIPGWGLKPKRATRKWRDPDATIAWLTQEGAEPEDYMEAKLRSPAQIEKLVGKKGIPGELVVAESSGLTLCRDSDPKAVPLGTTTAFDALP